MRKLILTIVVVIVLATILGQTAKASDSHAINTHTRTLYDQAYRAVCHYFKGDLCILAMNIVKCETGSTYRPWAANGQYLGIFQMGYNERRIFGHGNNVWAQSKAAFAYYSSDHSFSHWWNFEPRGCAR